MYPLVKFQIKFEAFYAFCLLNGLFCKKATAVIDTNFDFYRTFVAVNSEFFFNVIKFFLVLISMI